MERPRKRHSDGERHVTHIVTYVYAPAKLSHFLKECLGIWVVQHFYQNDIHTYDLKIEQYGRTYIKRQ